MLVMAVIPAAWIYNVILKTPRVATLEALFTGATLALLVGGSVCSGCPGETDRRYYTCALYTLCYCAASWKTGLRFRSKSNMSDFDCGCNQVMQPHEAGRK